MQEPQRRCETRPGCVRLLRRVDGGQKGGRRASEEGEDDEGHDGGAAIRDDVVLGFCQHRVRVQVQL